MRIHIDNQAVGVYDYCTGRLLPFHCVEVQYEDPKMVWSLAISKLAPCQVAGQTDLRIDS